MKRIIHRELLKIFSNIETAEDDAKDTALSGFAAELHGYCRREKDLAERTRTLRFARSELAIAQGRIYTRALKKSSIIFEQISRHIFLYVPIFLYL